MKKYYLFLALILAQSCSVTQNQGQSMWLLLVNDPPALTPTVFSRELVSGSGRIHSIPSFSNDGEHIYWMIVPPKVLHTSYVDGKWQAPSTPGFCENIPCLRPVFSSDNKRIYFQSNMEGGKGGQDIWYVDHKNGQYSSPVNLGSPVNTSMFEGNASFTKTGTVYFAATMKDKRYEKGIKRAKFENGTYKTPEFLPPIINTRSVDVIDYTPFIATDESFILFSSNRENPKEEDCHIYISFRDKNDAWSRPINLSTLMLFDHDSRDPYVSPDGKYLFFSSRGNFYIPDFTLLKDSLETHKNLR